MEKRGYERIIRGNRRKGEEMSREEEGKRKNTEGRRREKGNRKRECK